MKHNTESAINSFLVSNIFPGTCYSLTISCVCVFEILETFSEEAFSLSHLLHREILGKEAVGERVEEPVLRSLEEEEEGLRRTN